MLHTEQLSPLLQGPLPRRGGLPTPVRPWCHAYEQLSPIGHIHCANEAWDIDFISHCLNWGGLSLLQSTRLNVHEQPYQVLPHFSEAEGQLTLHTGPSDAAGADAMALMTGLAIESQKTAQALLHTQSPEAALKSLCAIDPKRWQHLSSVTDSLNLLDVLQALSLGAEDRYVQWQEQDTNTDALIPWLTDSNSPWYLFSGHTHRLWDGLSPLTTLFAKELFSLSGDVQDTFHGLDLLRTHQPHTHDERMKQEASTGIRCIGNMIAIDTAHLNIQHTHASFQSALKLLQTQKARLLLLPPSSLGLEKLQEIPSTPRRHIILLHGLSHQLEITLSASIYDVRNRRQLQFEQNGADLQMLPSFGFIPHHATGHFTNFLPFEGYKKGALKEAPHVCFTPIGIKDALLKASAQSLKSCARL